jgi:hypothetical protein
LSQKQERWPVALTNDEFRERLHKKRAALLKKAGKTAVGEFDLALIEVWTHYRRTDSFHKNGAPRGPRTFLAGIVANFQPHHAEKQWRIVTKNIMKILIDSLAEY